MFLDEQDYVEIVGQDGAKKLMPYTNAHLSGLYAYDAHPDSQLSLDQSTLIKRYVDWVNFMGKSGWLNMGEVARVGANLFGYNPSRMVQEPQPPPPPPINISLAIDAPGLASNLLLPEVRAILQAHGIQLSPTPSPEAIALAQQEAAKAQPHEGAMPKADKVDKHVAEETGNRAGPPNPAPVAQTPMPPEMQQQHPVM